MNSRPINARALNQRAIVPVVVPARIPLVAQPLYWSMQLGAIGKMVTGISDIAQCLIIILTTPTGSLPHRVDFGCDAWKYLDGPVPQVLPKLLRAVSTAIQKWEPRVKVTNTEVVADPDAPHHRTLKVTWVPIGSTSAPLQTAVQL